jgi:hypothetical protein
LGARLGRRRAVSGGKIAADTAFNTLALGPIGLLSALSHKGFEMFAVVSFADRTIDEKKFEKKNTDASSLTKAQAEAVRFNAVAAASQPIDRHRPACHSFTPRRSRTGRLPYVRKSRTS